MSTAQKVREILCTYMPRKDNRRIRILEPSVRVNLIGPHFKSTRQQRSGGAIILKYIRLTCVIMIDQEIDYFELSVGVSDLGFLNAGSLLGRSRMRLLSLFHIPTTVGGGIFFLLSC